MFCPGPALIQFPVVPGRLEIVPTCPPRRVLVSYCRFFPYLQESIQIPFELGGTLARGRLSIVGGSCNQTSGGGARTHHVRVFTQLVPRNAAHASRCETALRACHSRAGPVTKYTYRGTTPNKSQAPRTPKTKSAEVGNPTVVQGITAG